MKAGIVIDKWKLPIFTRHLKQAGFSYSEEGQLATDTILLTVETDAREPLQKVVVAATVECNRSKKK